MVLKDKSGKYWIICRQRRVTVNERVGRMQNHELAEYY